MDNDTGFDTDEFEHWNAVNEAIEDEYNPSVLLPVYLYNYDGLTISTSPFGCRRDSGQIGFAFIDIPTMKQWRLNGGDKTANELEEINIGNVRLYDDYLTDNVFGYTIHKTHGNVLDSCYGYYGDLGKMDMVEVAKSIIDNEIKQKAMKHISRVK